MSEVPEDGAIGHKVGNIPDIIRSNLLTLQVQEADMKQVLAKYNPGMDSSAPSL